MNPRNRGFNQALANLSCRPVQKEARQDFKAALATLKRRVRREQLKITEEDSESEDVSEPDLSELLPPVEFSRRVVLSTDQPLDTEDVLLVNDLYHAEGQMLNEFQKQMLSSLTGCADEDLEDSAPNWAETVEEFRGVEQRVRR